MPRRRAELGEPQKSFFFFFLVLARLRRRVLGPQELCVWYVEEPRRVHISCFCSRLSARAASIETRYAVRTQAKHLSRPYARESGRRKPCGCDLVRTFPMEGLRFRVHRDPPRRHGSGRPRRFGVLDAPPRRRVAPDRWVHRGPKGHARRRVGAAPRHDGLGQAPRSRDIPRGRPTRARTLSPI